jgi:ABC-type antimicrobial peptide transport system permease subunit
VVQGRDFSYDFPADTTNFLVTESAVKQLGLQNPVGQTITIYGGSKTGQIVGVVNDYNVRSLHQSILPVVMDIKENLNFGTILIRTEPGRTAEALEGLQKLYRTFNPGYAFRYSFLNDEYKQLYTDEQSIQLLSNTFGALSIVISCFGLLGLAMFSAEQRVKEMSIRKTLGASVTQLVTLFSMEFIKLIAIALLFAMPATWVIMNLWLQVFAYHIPLSWWIFAAGGLAAMALTLLTIGAQAVKTAYANPARTLRAE